MMSIMKPQDFPPDWSLKFDESSIPTERQLLYEQWMDEKAWSRRSLGIDTKALVFALMQALHCTDCFPPTIARLAGGSFNKVFLATFLPSSSSENESEDLKVVVRMPIRKARVPGRIEATAALMTFAREYLGLPIPRIYAWSDVGLVGIENPVNAPYIIMEYAPGVSATQSWYNPPDIEHWNKILDALTKAHARLAKPLPWKGYGSIYFAKSVGEGKETEDLTRIEAYRLGPFMPGPMATQTRRSFGPYQITDGLSLVEFWTGLWTKEVEYVKARHDGELTKLLNYDDCPEDEEDDTLTLSDFLATANHLLALIQQCPLPTDPRIYEPCIVPMDYALRNVTIDPSSLGIVSYLDWDDSAVLPFILCSRFVDEIATQIGITEEWLEDQGGFRFDPQVEEGKYEGELEELLQARVYALQKSRRCDQEEVGRPVTGVERDSGDAPDATLILDNIQDPTKGDDGLLTKDVAKESYEATVDVGVGDEDLGQSIERILDARVTEADRRSRIIETHFQRKYMELLGRCDERFAIPGFWEARQDALKIHHLLTYGWTEWMEKSAWIERRPQVHMQEGMEDTDL